MVKEAEITKEHLIELYKMNTGELPSWAEKKTTQFTKEEMGEYQKLRTLIKRQRKEIKAEKPSKDKITGTPSTEVGYDNAEEKTFEEYAEDDNIEYLDDETVNTGYYVEDNEWSDEEKYNLVNYTAKKVAEDLLTPEQKELLEKQREQDEFIEQYLRNHGIKDQAHLNYAIEHDEKFRIFLEKIGRLEQLYNGRHLKDIKEQQDKVNEELEKEAKEDKKEKVKKKFEKKTVSNDIKDAVKNLDLTAYRNKKLESQGFILCMYLRKNGLMDLKYVKMDEVGQIKVDGYVYHERDATYRFGKKNDPVLVIMEGALVPMNKETLKENLGFQSAEAQKLIIKGIEQAEVVKAGGIDENTKKPFAPPKWLIIVGIAIVIAIYAYMGGFS